MSFGYYTLNNNNQYPYKNINFMAENTQSVPTPLAKPIKTVSKHIENTVDTFVPQSEKEKKSNKKAIAVASSVVVITGLVALLNPKYSSKLMSKLKNMSNSAGTRLEKNKNSFFKSKFHKTTQKSLNFGIKTLEFSNNINSAKDVGFKWLCCKNKSFSSVKNSTIRNILKKIDSGFVKIMSKAHSAITKWFDGISKYTVKSKYKMATKRMDKFESLVKEYKNKLSPQEQVELDSKLNEITKAREFFSEKNTAKRFIEQEKSMNNLEQEFIKKLNSYKKGFTDKSVNRKEHINKNMTFWAENIMQPTRDNIERQGLNAVEKIVGNNNGKKGLYDDIYSMLSPKLSEKKKSALEKAMKKANNKLHKANHSETVEYFDKKRDLVLGGAPTDIVTAVAGLGLSGIAIATADTKEDKISRALTGGFPIIAGIGASMAFTAMLFSGVQGMLYGALTSVGLSKIGSVADHYIVGNMKNKKIVNNPNPTSTEQSKPQEVINA